MMGLSLAMQVLHSQRVDMMELPAAVQVILDLDECITTIMISSPS